MEHVLIGSAAGLLVASWQACGGGSARRQPARGARPLGALAALAALLLGRATGLPAMTGASWLLLSAALFAAAARAREGARSRATPSDRRSRGEGAGAAQAPIASALPTSTAGAVKFSCPRCNYVSKVPTALSGRTARCTGCREPLRVPAARGATPSAAGRVAVRRLAGVDSGRGRG
ncbi:MAG: hypothetical protein AB7N76_28925 [Planctomycetota bacterium]